MKQHVRIAIFALTLITPPAFAQDLPTDQLERHAEVVRQDMLVKSTVGRNRPSDAHGSRRATPRQAAVCAKKDQFRGQYGADHPKVKKLYDLCRTIGL